MPRLVRRRHMALVIYCGGPAVRCTVLVVCWPAGLTQVTEMVSPGLNRARMLARLAGSRPLAR